VGKWAVAVMLLLWVDDDDVELVLLNTAADLLLEEQKFGK
jgi:hypothetical protein